MAAVTSIWRQLLSVTLIWQPLGVTDAMAGVLPVVATGLDEATTPGDQPWCLVTALASSTWATLAERAARAAASVIFPPRLASTINMIQKHRHELDVGCVRVHGGERVGAKFAERGGESRARGGARKRRGCWGARPNDRTRSDVTERKLGLGEFLNISFVFQMSPLDDPWSALSTAYP